MLARPNMEQVIYSLNLVETLRLVERVNGQQQQQRALQLLIKQTNRWITRPAERNTTYHPFFFSLSFRTKIHGPSLYE